MYKIKAFWNYLNSTLWFTPTLIVLINILLALILIKLDSADDNKDIIQRFYLLGIGAEEARIMLSTIAGSMISIVGITFSMTVVTLALASSQYTSRILRNFMRNRITQIVIGTFIGIFAYCLIILCTIREGAGNEFIPNLAVLFAFLSALGGACILIFFIHHIASSIQASNILAAITNDTFSTIKKIYPENDKIESTKHIDIKEQLSKLTWTSVLAKKNGYIQSIDVDHLKQLAVENKLVIRIEHKIGSFVADSTPLASVSDDEKASTALTQSIHSAFIFNRYRDLDQDVSFGIRQLVDIALKALSPGINDTTTAVMCLNYLTSIMVQLATKNYNSSYHFEENELKLITKDHNFKTFLDESFDQIRENAKENTAIILSIIHALHLIIGQTTDLNRLKALHEQLSWLEEMAKYSLKLPHDFQEVNQAFALVNQDLVSRGLKIN